MQNFVATVHWWNFTSKISTSFVAALNPCQRTQCPWFTKLTILGSRWWEKLEWRSVGSLPIKESLKVVARTENVFKSGKTQAESQGSQGRRTCPRWVGGQLRNCKERVLSPSSWERDGERLCTTKNLQMAESRSCEVFQASKTWCPRRLVGTRINRSQGKQNWLGLGLNALGRPATGYN